MLRAALLLIAHGSRRPSANADLFAIADVLREQRHYPIVEPSFLELCEPSMEQGARKCVELGAERVILVPYFLSAGTHVRRDLKAFRDRMSAELPTATFVLAEPMGRHPLLLEIIRQRAEEATE